MRKVKGIINVMTKVNVNEKVKGQGHHQGQYQGQMLGHYQSKVETEVKRNEVKVTLKV